MKSFFDMFKDSARSLRDLRTLTTAGILLAMAIAVRSLSIEVTPDLRISFSYIPIAVIGMLYGPVVCGASSFLLDFLGFILTNKSARAYSPQLALVVVLSGILYGAILYHCEYGTKRDTAISTARIVCACVAVALICNLCLNSYFLYTLYVNKDFTLTGGDWNAFAAYCAPRAIKNLIEFPVKSLILSVLLPLLKAAYDRVQLQYGRKPA